MASISASEDVDAAVSESDVVGADGEIEMLFTVGAEFEDCSLIEIAVDRTQDE